MLSLAVLLLIFAASAAAIWVAGIQLSNQTDVLSTRLHLGSVLNELVLLAVATNLVVGGLAGLVPRQPLPGPAQQQQPGHPQRGDQDRGGPDPPHLQVRRELGAGDDDAEDRHDEGGLEDQHLTAVGALLTLVYLAGLIFRPQRRIARMGVTCLTPCCSTPSASPPSSPSPAPGS